MLLVTRPLPKKTSRHSSGSDAAHLLRCSSGTFTSSAWLRLLGKTRKGMLLLWCSLRCPLVALKWDCVRDLGKGSLRSDHFRAGTSPVFSWLNSGLLYSCFTLCRLHQLISGSSRLIYDGPKEGNDLSQPVNSTSLLTYCLNSSPHHCRCLQLCSLVLHGTVLVPDPVLGLEVAQFLLNMVRLPQYLSGCGPPR